MVHLSIGCEEGIRVPLHQISVWFCSFRWVVLTLPVLPKHHICTICAVLYPPFLSLLVLLTPCLLHPDKQEPPPGRSLISSGDTVTELQVGVDP